MRLAFASLLLVAALASNNSAVAGADDDIDALFASWRTRHVKVFSREEHTLRRAIFAANHAFIRAHNKRAGMTWKQAHNQFSHLSREEFSAYVRSSGFLRAPSRRRTAADAALPAAMQRADSGGITSAHQSDQSGADGDAAIALDSARAGGAPRTASLDDSTLSGEAADAASRAAEIDGDGGLPTSSEADMIAAARAPSPPLPSSGGSRGLATPASVDWQAAGAVSAVKNQGCVVFDERGARAADRHRERESGAAGG